MTFTQRNSLEFVSRETASQPRPVVDLDLDEPYDDNVLRELLEQRSCRLTIDLRTPAERAAALRGPRPVDDSDTNAELDDIVTVTLVRSRFRAVAKRTFDIVSVLITAPLWLPLLAVLAAITRLTSPGPAFYAHIRVGRDGRNFRCWKLRSMVNGADKQLIETLANEPELLAEYRLNVKLKNDPRVTKFGRVLRTTSFDELPQLINVLFGELSLVGPRPVTPEETVRYGAYLPLVLAATPGITGLWQVSGRSDLPYRSRVQLDLRYVLNQSLAGDIMILLRTAALLLRPSRRGAY